MGESISTDYLIIGAGAMGIAFADEIFNGDKNATITIVDRRESFGGHWNNAYPYVRLHQPAAFYGVNSEQLGNGSTDLSSKSEILDYYQKVQTKFLESNRVTFLKGHEYLGEDKVAPIKNLNEVKVIQVNKKTVDATYMNVEIPSTHKPKFEIESGVEVLPLNDLKKEHTNWNQFYVIGCGKTGFDAIIFLLDSGIDPENIFWITPNDAWLFNRNSIQVGTVAREVLEHGVQMIKTKDIDEVFKAIEKKGGILRIDETTLPKKWKCATVNPKEITQLRSIQNVIKMGRVKKITQREVILEKGEVKYEGKPLFVNCSADGLSRRPVVPIFQGKKITLQSIFFCQQVFSAACIGRLELTKYSEKRRNELVPIPHPQLKEDWPDIFNSTVKNLLLLHRFFLMWMFKSRLNFMSHEPFLKYLYYSAKAGIMAPRLDRVVKEHFG